MITIKRFKLRKSRNGEIVLKDDETNIKFFCIDGDAQEFREVFKEFSKDRINKEIIIEF